MPLSFDPISSAVEGQRDVAIDFGLALEISETILVPTVTSSHPDLLEVSAVFVNAIEIKKDEGGVIQIGKGVQMRLRTLAPTHGRCLWVDVNIIGSSNTKETYRVMVPVKDYLKS